MQPKAPESSPRPSFNDDASPADAFKSAAARFAEIKSYAAHYFSAKVDGYASSAKTAILFAILGLLAGVAGAAILATAGVLVVLGVAEALTPLLGDRVWLADLLTGFLLLGTVLGAAYFLVSSLVGKSRAAAKAKYEALNREQFAKHGHNVHERATAE